MKDLEIFLNNLIQEDHYVDMNRFYPLEVFKGKPNAMIADQNYSGDVMDWDDIPVASDHKIKKIKYPKKSELFGDYVFTTVTAFKFKSLKGWWIKVVDLKKLDTNYKRI